MAMNPNDWPGEWQGYGWEQTRSGRPFLYVHRKTGIRVHIGGLIQWPDRSHWQTNQVPDAWDPLYSEARAREPTKRRALLWFAAHKAKKWE